jgi:hypothetical protein
MAPTGPAPKMLKRDACSHPRAVSLSLCRARCTHREDHGEADVDEHENHEHLGFGRIVTLQHRPATSYQIHLKIRWLLVCFWSDNTTEPYEHLRAQQRRRVLQDQKHLGVGAAVCSTHPLGPFNPPLGPFNQHIRPFRNQPTILLPPPAVSLSKNAGRAARGGAARRHRVADDADDDEELEPPRVRGVLAPAGSGAQARGLGAQRGAPNACGTVGGWGGGGGANV